MKVLLSGGAGYIGSHTALALLEAGHDISIADNLCNSSAVVIDRLQELGNSPIPFYQIDVAETDALRDICSNQNIDAIIHFAGLKAVAESVADPLRYYDVNLSTTVSICRVMLDLDIRHLVFSSSATVYGEPERIPLDENCRLNRAANPYGRTKQIGEKILTDLQETQPRLNIALLRYFNPAGAHPSARIGEDPSGIPSNLVPVLTQVAIGKLQQLTINGEDYDTDDGTCVRDYIHVQDLASGHVAALDKLATDCGLVTYNLGTGRGYSVREVIATFERATNQHLNKQSGPRRAGDVAVSYTDPGLAEKELDWKAERSIDDICRDAWLWQQENPNGYE